LEGGSEEKLKYENNKRGNLDRRLFYPGSRFGSRYGYPYPPYPGSRYGSRYGYPYPPYPGSRYGSRYGYPYPYPGYPYPKEKWSKGFYPFKAEEADSNLEIQDIPQEDSPKTILNE
jgi:hypothetical protein